MESNNTPPRTTIVVPTIRETCISEFLEAWGDAFARAHVIVVEDNPTRTMDLGAWPNLTHLCWEDIENDLGDDAWIVPRRTDCVRSYGYWKAWLDRPDMVVTLDDDCFPGVDGPHGFLARHWERLEAGGRDLAWRKTGGGVPTRGHPYQRLLRERRCVINHGLWTNVPDYDAITQLALGRDDDAGRGFEAIEQTIPPGQYFPMCGMNLAFRPEVIPALYFLLMGPEFPYDRFGDIWAGVFVKRICDHLGVAINSGCPAIEHKRASHVWTNLRKESPGLELNESLWTFVDAAPLAARTFGACYLELAETLADESAAPAYLGQLARAMRIWAGLFDAGRTVPDEVERPFVSAGV